MISFLKGTLISSDETGAVIDVGGVGFEVTMPLLDIGRLPQSGEETTVFTYLYVQEDVLALFGFMDRASIKIFKLLTGVSGVGPKAAISLLSLMPPEDIAAAIISSDAKAIGRAKGIGAKTAQRIVLELKGKIDTNEAVSQSRERPVLHKASADASAVNALIALGASPSEAQKTVVEISGEGNALSTEEIIKEALRRMSSGI